ncbi:esterase/lipase family protein [Sinomonas sp. G460-2]|uniref:esterase/lipase family protein n=1 Tax=Sinomonas sp. G460-2 TaxID=3393464 RepID=UPI0039F0A0C5
METSVQPNATPRRAFAVARGVVLDAGYAVWRHAASLAHGSITEPRVHAPKAAAARPLAARADVADSPAAEAGPARPPAAKADVVLIPGIYEPAGFMDPLRRWLQRRGHRVIVLPELGYNRRSIPECAALAAARLRELGVRNAVVVAHSKGGLIGKLLMTAPDTERLVSRMLAVGTPFEGTRYSRYAPTRPLRSFYPEHPVMGLLAKNLEVNSRIVSVGADVDPLVGRSTGLVGARNIILPVTGHFRILEDPGLFEAVDDFLRAGEQAG